MGFSFFFKVKYSRPHDLEFYIYIFFIDLPYGDNISPLLFEVTEEDNTRLHVKIYDPNNKRWEVPERLDHNYNYV